jgi:hypothetical protein
VSAFSSESAQAHSRYDDELQQGLTNDSFASWVVMGNAPAFGAALQAVQSNAAQVDQLGSQAFS